MRSSGNVLFLILIAVVLFAALSYAVTQSFRGGGSVDREALRIEAAQLVQYFSSIKHAIDRMKLVSGCSDTDITFYGTPAKPECGIFDPAGGNIPVSGTPATCCNPSAIPPIDNYDIPNSNSPCNTSGVRHIMIRKIWIKGVGKDYEQDLVLTACGIPDELCDIIGVHNSTSGTQFSTFEGSYDTTSVNPSVRQFGFSGGLSLIGLDMHCTSSEPTKRLNMVVLAR